ncbi:amidohydrolase [Microbacterium mangrovi]|uniref:Amidohydrolase n=1 Tax=Microbacterium mangrovi TaxID=1348253 RepID=A0A0B2A1I4_9MICO|nr:amidohydrolase [Microbacterium mangrovi]KHK95664.1 amidohydrolase [Microbacterium mangrovi]
MNTADALISAATVHTLDPATRGDTIAVRDGRILGVGTRAELEALRGPGTREVDYGAAVITPGLNDSHTHVVFGLEMTRGSDLTDLPMREVRQRLLAAAQDAAPDAWVQGWGLDPNLFTGIGFGGRVFDEITGSVPMFLRMRDGHSAIVNTAALDAAGITGRETFADESRVDVDVDGRPTGYLVELAAIDLVVRALPGESGAERRDRFRDVLRGMAARGIASTHVMDFADDSRALVEALEQDGDLPVRLRFSPMVLGGASMDELASVAALQGVGGRRWGVHGVKFFIDGTIDNGSAWLERPDAYGQGTTSVWSDPTAYAAALGYFVERGIPTATHAIGDRGVAYVLDALEAMGEARRRTAHRIEHIETIPDDLVTRFHALGVAASMQPIHGTHHTRADRTDNWSVRLGTERAARGWRCRDIRNAGGILALGSDWPITPYDPLAMMADSILRRPALRPDVDPVQPEQALTALMALEGYTSHAAAAAGLTDVTGTISAGKRADLTVFAEDPLIARPEDLVHIPVIGTVLDGRAVAAFPQA